MTLLTLATRATCRLMVSFPLTALLTCHKTLSQSPSTLVGLSLVAGRFTADSPPSALVGVSLAAGDSTPAEEDAITTSGVVVTGGVPIRLAPLDGDGVASRT